MCIKVKANIFTDRGKLTRWMDGAYKPRTLPSFGNHGLSKNEMTWRALDCDHADGQKHIVRCWSLGSPLSK